MNIKDIKNPDFLSELKEQELYELSADIRQFLLNSISKTGGHLSSNLGVVELSVALHKVFNSPDDQLFFDVGHQCYTHKILTGRASDFDSLRKFKGLSGFIRREESVHDVWEAGHASTAISGALGYKLGNSIKNKEGYVVAVVGDASVAGGMSFEALNHIGELHEKIIIILNDNEMAISRPIGGMTKSLSKVRYSAKYYNLKKRIYKVLRKLPLGTKLSNYIIKTKNNFKRNNYKDSLIFNGLGIEYYGPVDGHSYEELLTVLEHVKKLNEPVVVHVKTKKGKGYEKAEKDVEGEYHGVGAFDIETGVVSSKNSNYETWSNLIIWTIEDLAKTNKDLIVLTPAMENGSRLKKFKEKYPDRYVDVGIAEEHAITMGTGLSLSSMHPVISIYSTFLQRGYDQVLHDVGRTNTKMILCVDRSGLVGADGDTHQGIYDVAFLKTIPNVVICMPKDAIEAQHLLNTCVNYDGPIAIRYPRGSTLFNKVEKYELFEIGKWEVVLEGRTDCVISYGSNVVKIKEYAEENNFNIGVVNARFINPIDREMIKEVANKYSNIYVYEEVIGNNNLYTDVIKCLYENNINVNVKSICLPNGYIEHGSVDKILEKYGMDMKTLFSNFVR